MSSNQILIPFSGEVEKGAVLSDCGRYRFELWRIWDHRLPKVLWIMHNPSTADATVDDPTIRRCISFSRNWGYGGLYVGNLFPYRATHPKDLNGLDIDELCPVRNAGHTNRMANLCKLRIIATGNPVVEDAMEWYIDDNWHYLKLTKKGYPCHPLYLPGNLRPRKLIYHNPGGMIRLMSLVPKAPGI